jgi:hypothetical protein
LSYRVYDKKRKKFVTDNIFLTPDGELVESKKSLFGNKLTFVDQNRFVYQKYIELEDKNNCPIFMGDYVKAQVAEDREVVGLVTFASELSSYVILCFDSEEYFTLGSEVASYIEVVGNVFDDLKKGK